MVDDRQLRPVHSQRDSLPGELVADVQLAACKANNLAFLEQVTPDNVVDQIGAGVMIGAGRHAQAAAAIGRKHTQRPEPW